MVIEKGNKSTGRRKWEGKEKLEERKKCLKNYQPKED